jgi:predicted nucleic acid-binding protein
MQPREAQANVVEFRKCIHVLEENAGVSQTLLQLVNQHHLKGKRIHDANIVATMMENGLIQVLTINGKDFSKFKEVKVIEPQNLAS